MRACLSIATVPLGLLVVQPLLLQCKIWLSWWACDRSCYWSLAGGCPQVVSFRVKRTLPRVPKISLGPSARVMPAFSPVTSSSSSLSHSSSFAALVWLQYHQFKSMRNWPALTSYYASLSDIILLSWIWIHDLSVFLYHIIWVTLLYFGGCSRF